MVPNASKPGYSFLAAGQYFNSDKRLGNKKWLKKDITRDRVAWVTTRNLMTEDPTVATRIMIATALDANRLKELTGIKNTGRKGAAHVQTLSLAWHPGEKVTRAEMEQAADEVIALLELTEHQVTIYCHTDTLHPHIHLMANRVHPQTGLMAGMSNVHRKLDKWSHEYEKRRGKILSPNRDEKYRRMEKAKERYPDDDKRKEWVITKRKEAAEKSKARPNSERWLKIKAAEAKRAALKASKAKAAELAAQVPLDRQEAAERLLGPLMKFQQTSSVGRQLATAVFAHDPESDIRGLLERNLPGLRNSTDPREVFNMLIKDYEAWSAIESEIFDNPEMEVVFDRLPSALNEAANRLRDTPWVTVERNIGKWFGQRIAETIRRAVDFLANLFRDEKIAKLEEIPETPVTSGSDQPKAPAPDYGGNYSP